ncbi:tripartite motif-containing protein 3-like [Branchiostoma floridae]|uniref:RING-type E3 ubiquitin transferase n=1 Tax=Branchiostoma floridae TaxID=7739 RepID=A0A9J7N0U1_BRAFL|nr:tripartite motif-containing protein 3-like [Branchiostoma floridae]
MAAATSSLGKEIQEELSCSICLELFTRPKMLPCQHTFCEDCLQDHVGVQIAFQCPTCELQVKVPSQGITGLPDNNLVTILCGRLRKQGAAPAETRKQPQSGNRCSFHPTEELRLYCKQCQVPVCNECLDETHSDHSTITIKKASQEKRAPIQALINEGRNILETYRSSLQGINDTEKTLQEQKQQTEKSITTLYNQMALALLKGKDNLLDEVEQNHSQNIAVLQNERDRISTDVDELSAACDRAEQAWRGGLEFLAQETTLTDILGKYRAKGTPAPVQAQLAVTVFQPTDAAVPVLGHVMVQSPPSAPSSIPAAPPTSNNAAARVIGRRHSSQNGVQAKKVSFGRKRSDIENISLLTSLASADDDVASEGTGHHHGNQHQRQQQVKKVSFTTSDDEVISGQNHDLHTEHQDQSLTFGGKGPEAENLDLPSGVVVSEEGEVFVGDYKDQKVKVFTLEGTFVRQFPTVVQDGKKMEPHDVAMDEVGNLWVAGSTTSAELAVQYTKRGRLLSTISLQKTGQVRGVAVDSKRNHILVTQATREVDKSNGVVQVFSPDGTLLRTVGGKPAASWQQGLKVPQFIAVDGEGNILVSDCHSHLIFVYGAEGQFLFKFGGEGSSKGQLKSPQGICTDSSGNIIVADRKNSRVELYDQTGTFVRHIATGLRWPWAVAMATQGQIVVTNADKSTVTIFQSAELN